MARTIETPLAAGHANVKGKRKVRIALMCFFPDWGHVQPLLKLAKVVRDAGYDVKCYIPAKSKTFVERLQIDRYILSSIQTADADEYASVAKKSLFILNYSGYSHTNLLINPKIIASIVPQIPAVIDDIKKFSPDILVGDSHIFSEIYEDIAQLCGAEFVKHNPSGTLAGKHRDYIRIFGDSSKTPGEMSLVEMVGKLFEGIYRPLFYFTHAAQWFEARKAKRALSHGVAGRKPSHGHPRPAWALTSGLTWVEDFFLGGDLASDERTRSGHLPPLPSTPEEISDDLDRWLKSASDPVVYISMGSVLRLPDAASEAIAKSLKALPCRTIWSTPQGQAPQFMALSEDPRFFVTSYAPQAELLKRPEIACFVTHAGASSVQESLLGGVPLICVPLHADNGYISHLVERLGVGVRVWKQELRTSRFGEELRRVLTVPTFRDRAKAIAAALEAADGPQHAVDYFERIRSQLPADLDQSA